MINGQINSLWPYSNKIVEVLTSKPLLKVDELLTLMRSIRLWLHNTRVDVFFSGSAALDWASDQFCFLSGCWRLLRHGWSNFLPPRRRGHTQHPRTPLLKDVIKPVRGSRQAEAHGIELVSCHSRHRHCPTPKEGRGVRVAAAMRRFSYERGILCHQWPRRKVGLRLRKRQLERDLQGQSFGASGSGAGLGLQLPALGVWPGDGRRRHSRQWRKRGRGTWRGQGGGGGGVQVAGRTAGPGGSPGVAFEGGTWSRGWLRQGHAALRRLWLHSFFLHHDDWRWTFSAKVGRPPLTMRSRHLSWAGWRFRAVSQRKAHIISASWTHASLVTLDVATARTCLVQTGSFSHHCCWLVDPSLFFSPPCWFWNSPVRRNL